MTPRLSTVNNRVERLIKLSMADPYDGERQGSSVDTTPEKPCLEVQEVLRGPPHEGETGVGLLFHTNRGDLRAILHRAEGSCHVVVWVCGARAGFGGHRLEECRDELEQLLTEWIPATLTG